MAFYNEMLAAAWEIIRSPFEDLSALWLIAPLFIMWLVLELYFDINKDEKLGWNTALGNGITMFWISVSLMRYLFTNDFEDFTFLKLAMVIVLLAYSMFIAYISFTHKLSPKATFLFASPTPVYYFSGIFILWVYGSLVLSWWILLDVFLLFGLLLLFVLLFRKIIPGKESSYGEGL